jgi:hypothetical protein
MSQENLTKVIERASTDAAFRSQLQSNPEAALASYDLTAEEKAALRSGDASKLSELGVDARVTKLDGSGNIWDNQNTSFASGGD